MSQVIQARCPRCKNLLRIPADWLGRPLRCKHCREVFRGRSTISAAAVASPPAPAPVAGPANEDPFAFAQSAAETAPLLPPRSGTRRKSGWWKGLMLASCVAGVGVAVFLLAGPHLGNLFQARPDPEPEKNSQKENGLAPASKEPSKAENKKSQAPPSSKKKGSAKKGSEGKNQ